MASSTMPGESPEDHVLNDRSRGFKKFMRKMGMSHPVGDAFTMGQEAEMSRNRDKRKNPFPKGRRHDMFEEGRKLIREQYPKLRG